MIYNRIGFFTLVRREILRFFVVFTQTLFPPLIAATLFLFIFGLSIGGQLNMKIHGMSYVQFLVPGLVMMHLIESSYANTSSSLFISRWHNLIQEMLLSPLSYLEMVIGLMTGGVVRGCLVGSGVYLLSMLFTPPLLCHPFLAVYFFLAVTIIFSCLGLLTALWADSFEKLSVWGTFVLTPLIYFGGVFHSVEMVPNALRFLTYLNPIFYLVSGMRYSLLGISDAPLFVCVGLAAFLAIVLCLAVEYLFRKGYKLRT